MSKLVYALFTHPNGSVYWNCAFLNDKNGAPHLVPFTEGNFSQIIHHDSLGFFQQILLINNIEYRRVLFIDFQAMEYLGPTFQYYHLGELQPFIGFNPITGSTDHLASLESFGLHIQDVKYQNLYYQNIFAQYLYPSVMNVTPIIVSAPMIFVQLPPVLSNVLPPIAIAEPPMNSQVFTTENKPVETISTVTEVFIRNTQACASPSKQDLNEITQVIPKEVNQVVISEQQQDNQETKVLNEDELQELPNSIDMQLPDAKVTMHSTPEPIHVDAEIKTNFKIKQKPNVKAKSGKKKKTSQSVENEQLEFDMPQPILNHWQLKCKTYLTQARSSIGAVADFATSRELSHQEAMMISRACILYFLASCNNLNLSAVNIDKSKLLSSEMMIFGLETILLCLAFEIAITTINSARTKPKTHPKI